MTARSSILAAIAVALAAAGGAWWWRSPQPTPLAAASPPTVVLITIDTLRADRVGAYGWTRARTPALDGLVARGVRFDRAFAAAPITLPSHASLLTGLYPPGHGSRHNGMRIRPDVPTLAEILTARGWATGAFVGAFPLDRRFGLDRGFARYGDRMPRGEDGRPLNERPGSAVVDEALAWVADAADRPAFLWVHFFEPHAPYAPDPSRGPGAAALPAEVRYDDEIAAVDRETARLLAGLRSRLGSAIVVVAGDHGEAFGEHGEVAHSVFVYDTTLRVPLAISAPGVRASVVRDNVSLVDVMPTVLDLAGIPRPDTDGVSLVPLLRGGAAHPRELYAESFAPLLDFGWSPLRCVRSGGLKYIEAPRPELFDVEADPGESADLTDQRADDVRALSARVGRYSGPDVPSGPGAAADAESRARLGALGYISGPTRRAVVGARPDPKDRKELAVSLAVAFSGELSGDTLRVALTKLAAQDPGNAQVRTRLGYSLIEAGRPGEAAPHFRAAIAAGMPSADPYLGLALCLVEGGRPADAMRVLTDATAVEPGNAVVRANLGTVALEAGEAKLATSHLAAAVTMDPELHQARFNLVRAFARDGRRAEALAQAEELLRRLPAAAPQRAEVERLIQALR